MNFPTPNRRDFLKALQLTAACAATSSWPALAEAPGKAAKSKRPPNLVIIMSDDVGIGDLGCYGATGVSTPNIDKLARLGQRFTDAHSDAATCSPSRFATLTGQYAWRGHGIRILPGDAPLTIPTNKPTIATVLRGAGYATGCVGKWHLGLGDGNIDWNTHIAPGPNDIGFDYSFIIPATPDRVPCVYVENGRVANLDPKDPITVSYKKQVGHDPIGREHPELLRYGATEEHSDTIVDHISRIGYMSGGNSARWVDEDMEQTITAKAVSFIEANHKAAPEKPFFLYFANNDIHVPHAPNKEFLGTSGCGIRCDTINQLDWSVGQIVATLERLHLAEDTLIVFTSDNGPIVNDGYDDGSDHHINGHTAAGPLRGGKYQIYEGGTRLPFISYWPGTIQPGVSDALIGQVDFLATFAAIAGTKPPAGAGPDSEDLAPALLGKSKQGRTVLVEEASTLAIRQGNWKLVANEQHPGDGLAANGQPTPVQARRKRQKDEPPFELYDLSTDIGETNNLAATHPEKVQELKLLLEKIRAKG